VYKINKDCWLKNDKSYINSFGKWTKNKVIRVCPKCKGEKEVTMHSVTRTGNTYCNGCLRTLKTMNEVLGKKYGEAVVVGFSKPRIDSKGRKVLRAKCECSCGKSFVADAQALKHGNTKSCGCVRRDRSGEKNPAYKHDLSQEEREQTRFMRNSSLMQEWKREVKEIFGNRCFFCGSNESVEAHHVESFKDNKHLRYDTQNGVCLCRKHHFQYHLDFLGSFKIPATKQSFTRYMEWYLCQLQNC
jgi:hypothetical protein